MADTAVCPVCGKPSGSAREKPFCSRRCADVDLGRWLTGTYRLPADDNEDDGSQRQDQE